MSRISKEAFELTPAKRALLETLLGDEDAAGRGSSAIPKATYTDTAPLSFAQRRLWFLDQLQPGLSAYNMPGARRLKGVLNADALERSLTEIIRRHETLRTSFPLRDKEPVQFIAPAQPFTLPVIDLSQFPPPEREAEARRLAREEAERPFELSAGPLLRASLLRLEEADHILLITMHHIISDNWSRGVFQRELSTFYNAYRRGAEPRLPELVIQYADYAIWQREWLQGEVLQEQLSYWKKQLAGAPMVLELPTDRPRPAAQSFRARKQPIRIAPELQGQLKQLSRSRGVTLFMTLLAAYQLLLSRYSGQTDIVVGSPSAGRNHAEVEGLIGLFINSLVLRADLVGEQSFSDLLRQVREVCLGAYAHQELPFEKLVEELRPERSPSHQPLFQVMFQLQNAPRETASFGSLRVTNFRRGVDGTANFDLYLSLVDTAQGLTGAFEYSTDLFDDETIARMSAHFQTLLSAIITDAQQRISQLPLLRPEERHQLLFDWNDTTAPLPSGLCVHQLFEAQVEHTPDATALIFQDKHLSYRELNRRANQLAHYLQAQGVGPETLVGICLERSPEMLISVLAVLKAGGAYLPLDAQYPEHRLRFMIEDAALELLLTQHSLQEKLSSIVSAQSMKLLSVDAAHRELAALPAANPASEVALDNSAYLIYTSGSTGTPKGVLVSHRGLPNLVRAQQLAFALSGQSRVLQFASLSFDASVSEIFVTLTCGATLYLSAPQTVWAGAAITGLLEEGGISAVTLPPTVLKQVGEARLEQLETVVSAGESCPEEVVRRWARGRRFINAYGPTEATVCAALWEAKGWVEQTVQEEAEEQGPEARVAIGKPIANTELYVLDEEMEPVPVGVRGELYIGGAGLARGYLRRAGLTAERFVPHPYSEQQGERLYRTGDICRYRVDGNIEYLGRMDEQVKVRGYRIELGEIESVLREHPAIENCVVIARSAAEGDVSLVAYLVGERGQEGVSSAELRSYLRERLPEYMLPSAFVQLAEMPLTPSGKIDRRALPEPQVQRVEDEDGSQSPRTAIEELIAGIWCEVLKVERVGAEENFFELGGHSLLAMQVVSRVQELFSIDVEVALQQIFESPTVRALAESIEAEQGEGEKAEAELARVSREQRLPLSFAQQRLWFLNQLEPESPFYNIPLARRFRELDVGVLERSLTEIVRRHETLRTSFAVVDGEAMQVIAPAESVILPVIDLSELPTAEREQQARALAREAASRAFDLTIGPLLRMQLLRLSAAEHVLLITMHHIISDNWSRAVLLRELSTLYNAYSRGVELSLPELPIQYADYAIWQREWLQGEVLQEQLSYWKEQLAGAPAIIELPTDYPRPPMQSYLGRRQSLRLSAELTRQLRALGQREGSTMFMTLLAAFQLLLSRYSGQQDICVGSPIAGRNRRELESLIGFFVNTLVLRADLTGKQSFTELLQQVRTVCLGAYAHQEIPFEKLVEELQPARSLSYQPLFQVMFELEHVRASRRPESDSPADSSDASQFLRSTHFSQEAGHTAKFDLTLSLIQTGEAIAGSIEYSTDLFERDSIERMASHFQNLLSAIADDPLRSLSDLPLLSAAERHQLIFDCNQTAADFPLHLCFHQLLEAQAERTPSAIAVHDGQHQWSYSELALRAERVVHHLVTAGAGVEQVVAVSGERNSLMLAAMLGVLRAGAVYWPVERAQTAGRVRQMLRGSQAKLILSSREEAGWWQQVLEGKDEETVAAELKGASAGLAERPQVLILEDVIEETESATQSAPLAAPVIDPRNLAYLIYTSGSTGTPKGALIEHRGMINHLFMEIRDLSLSGSDRVGQTASRSFDISIWQFLAALLVGARVEILSDEQTHDPEQLLQAVAERGITILEVVPSMLRAMLDVEEQQRQQRAEAGSNWAERLRWLMVTGEAFSRELSHRWARMHGTRVRVLNAYGPTECSDDVTQYEVNYSEYAEQAEQAEGKQTERQVQSESIGKAGWNLQVYVLDERLQVVPIGVLGEICVGGVGVGRGYIGDARRTAEVFVPDPYSLEGGARLYRTGDVGRYLEDGRIEYVGRKDEQVKVRGYRIELGEIEAAIREHRLVTECVVMARREEGAEPRLVGYIVGAEEADGEMEGELRAYLRERLPEYMQPSALVILAEMPLTANGKIDRKALPAPELREQARGQGEGPRTLVEEMLAGIWSELLKRERVAIDDNFFELGGHSLLAMQAISRTREAFRIELALRTIFEAPTIRALAEKVAEAQRSKDEASIRRIPVAARGRKNLDELVSELTRMSEQEVRLALDEE